jgi:hypothetical protein
MSRLILAAERVERARGLILQTRQLAVPTPGGRHDFSYIAQVKALLQQARDLVKFIPKTPSATVEVKEQVSQIFHEIEAVEQELLHSPDRNAET